MKRLIYFSFIVSMLFTSEELLAQSNRSKKLISLSRNSCVKILANGTPMGSGFFIKDDLIVTCFHVIAQIQISANNVSYQVFKDLVAINESGESVPLECISLPTVKSPEPYVNDFAILRLKSKMERKQILNLSKRLIKTSDNIVFSGYPFGLQTLITHSANIWSR
jgi:hypothetical protein